MIYILYIYIYIYTCIYAYVDTHIYITFNGRLALEQLHEVVTSHIVVSFSFAKTGFISLSCCLPSSSAQCWGKII